jgi:predicted nucleic acid-binding protein
MNCDGEIIGLANVLLDTSVWIEFMRGREPVCSEVRAMLDNDMIVCNGIILAELLQGVKSGNESKFIKNFPDVFEFPAETVDRWMRSGELAAAMRAKGVTVPLSDCFIAVSAVDAASELVSADNHFEEIARFIPLKFKLIA